MDNKFNKELFGQRLTVLMKEFGDTIYNLASFVHLTPSAISRYKNGGHVPRADVVESIAQRYNVNPLWLMGVSPDRYIEVEGLKNITRVPFLGFTGAAGGLLREEEIEKYFAADIADRVDFALEVRGNDMEGAGIRDGDIVYIRRQSKVENGEVAVVLIDGVAQLRRYYQFGGLTILHPANPHVKAESFLKTEGVHTKVVGKVSVVKSKVI